MTDLRTGIEGWFDEPRSRPRRGAGPGATASLAGGDGHLVRLLPDEPRPPLLSELLADRQALVVVRAALDAS